MSEPNWPSIEEQLAEAQGQPMNRLAGTELERFIRANQDFEMLPPEEAANTKIDLPPWLRVAWRKAHPEMEYRTDDPTGGYPLALELLHEWMVTHPDLQPRLGDDDTIPPNGNDPPDSADAAPDSGGPVALLDREATSQDREATAQDFFCGHCTRCA